jgi:SAM-dependent methyltransferase
MPGGRTHDHAARGSVTVQRQPILIGYDDELQRHNEILRRACDLQLHDHVLDIGCGSGQTTRQAAGLARAGSALGVDVSAPAIERARELARAEGLGNVSFEHADAQQQRFESARFDLVISRFGTMFFDDPLAAFGNIGGALRPGGRLVMLVWQTMACNEWAVAIRQALNAGEQPATDASAQAAAFSLADPAAATELLQAAGFTNIAFTDVDEPVYYGPDVAAALAWVGGFLVTKAALERLDPAAGARAVERLRELCEVHLRDDGVWFGSRAWIITAHRERKGGN